MQLDQNMTDKFLEIFFSNIPVVGSRYQPEDSIWIFSGYDSSGSVAIVSYRTQDLYVKWQKTLPPLLLELK